MKRRAGSALLEHNNQYPPMPGLPELRQVEIVLSARPVCRCSWRIVGSLDIFIEAFLKYLCLMQAVARHSAAQSGIEADWQTETLITVGATEALTSAFMGLLNEGDEVRPLYTLYGI